MKPLKAAPASSQAAMTLVAPACAAAAYGMLRYVSWCCFVLQVPRDIRLLPHRLPKPDYSAEDSAGASGGTPAPPAAAVRSPSPSSGVVRSPSPGAAAAVRSPSPRAAGVGVRSPSPVGGVARSPSPGAGGAIGVRPSSAVRAGVGAAAGDLRGGAWTSRLGRGPLGMGGV